MHNSACYWTWFVYHNYTTKWPIQIKYVHFPNRWTLFQVLWCALRTFKEVYLIGFAENVVQKYFMRFLTLIPFEWISHQKNEYTFLRTLFLIVFYTHFVGIQLWSTILSIPLPTPWMTCKNKAKQINADIILLKAKISFMHFLAFTNRAVFNWMSKVSKDCFGFASLSPVIGQKLKTIVTWSPAFSRALCNLVIFTLSSRWLFRQL